MLKFKGPKCPGHLVKVPRGGIAIGPLQKHAQECAVASLFKKGDCVSGGIVFSGRSEKFEYIPNRGTVMKTLTEQCPLLKSRNKDLGEDRLDDFHLQYDEDGERYKCRLFCRVLYGKI